MAQEQQQIRRRGELGGDVLKSFFYIQPVLPEIKDLSLFSAYRELGNVSNSPGLNLIDGNAPESWEQISPEQKKFREVLRKVRCLEAYVFFNVVKDNEGEIREKFSSSDLNFQEECRAANFARQHEIIQGLHPGLNLTHYEYLLATSLKELFSQDIHQREREGIYLREASRQEFVREYFSDATKYIKGDRIWLHLALSLHQGTLFKEKGDLYQSEKEWFSGVSRASRASVLEYFYRNRKIFIAGFSGENFFLNGRDFLSGKFLRNLNDAGFPEKKKSGAKNCFCEDVDRRWVLFPSDPVERLWREMERVLFSLREGENHDFHLAAVTKEKRRKVFRQVMEKVRLDKTYKNALCGKNTDIKEVIKRFPIEAFLKGGLYPESW